MASTAVRYPTPQRVDGSTQHTSVEVTDPLLWQGQRQGRAEGGASTLQLFNLLLFSVRIAKATCPSDTPSTMVGKWGQHCEPAGGLMLSWARASRDGWPEHSIYSFNCNRLMKRARCNRLMKRASFRDNQPIQFQESYLNLHGIHRRPVPWPATRQRFSVPDGIRDTSFSI